MNMRSLYVMLFSGLLMAQGASAHATGAVANVKKEIKLQNKSLQYHTSLLQAASVHTGAMRLAGAGAEKEALTQKGANTISIAYTRSGSQRNAGPQLTRMAHNQAGVTANQLKLELGHEGAREYVKGLVASNEKNVKELSSKSAQATAISEVQGTTSARAQAQSLAAQLVVAKSALKAAQVQQKVLRSESHEY